MEPLAVYGSGLTLIVALTVAGWICRSLWGRSRDRREAEARVRRLREIELPTHKQRARLETWRNYYGRTYPRTARRR